MNRRRLLRIATIVILVVAGIWIVGDWIYSLVIASRHRAWEAGVKRHSDGVREGCEAFDVGEGDTAILLVHGINDSPACYRDIARALADRGYACRAMRIPGFAEPLERYARTRREQWREAVHRELKSLRRDHPRVGLVAHSLGGAISIDLLIDDPKAADMAALIAPAVEVSNDRSPLLPTRGWHEIANRLLIFTTVTESPFPLDAQKADDKTYPYRTPFSPRKVADETFHLLDKNRGCAEQFQTPLLMLLSKDDVVVSWRAAEEFHQQASSKTKRLVFVENTGHSMVVDHVWPRLVKEIDDFFRARPETP